MPTILTKASASAQGFGFSLGGKKAVYVEDVFSTYLYTGNGSTQTITNNIDLSTKGGMVWTKSRSASGNNWLYSTSSAQGTGGKGLISNDASDISTYPTYNNIQSFNVDGFTLGTASSGNQSNINSTTYASWTFRKQPKFFDIVTYTGDGSDNRQITHSLGSTPGMIIVKCTSDSTYWNVWHRSLSSPTNDYLYLNTNYATQSSTNRWGSTGPTATTFGVGQGSSSFDLNYSGKTYVAYLFAHDAGGFGAAGTDSVVACGSATADGSGVVSLNLGWEPQFLLIKPDVAGYNWTIVDIIRNMSWTGTNFLNPNTSGSETVSGSNWVSKVNATGVVMNGAYLVNAGQTIFYIAIRRGPMKTPTDATKVFTPVAFSGNSTSDTQITSGFVTDWFFDMQQVGGDYWNVFDRLRGYNPRLLFQLTNAEDTPAAYYSKFDNMTGVLIGSGTGMNGSGKTYSAQMFRRAPGFFDVVCYTGTNVASQSVSHNLSVAPTLIITKARNASATDWYVYSSDLGTSKYLRLNFSDASANYAVFPSSPTSSAFTFDSSATYGSSTIVAYLFATCAGVSKVGSYTGTGAAQNINCGFSSSARFILIKRTDSTGDWYVYDSARGISSGNDPYLLINSTAAEVTGTDYVNTYASGFALTSSAPAGLNANGGTYIFLAIA